MARACSEVDLLAIADAERERIAETYKRCLDEDSCTVGGYTNKQWSHLEGAVMVVNALRKAIAAQSGEKV